MLYDVDRTQFAENITELAQPVCVEAEGNFFKGLLIALPLSLVFWGALITVALTK